MTGNNKIILNNATMQEAIQFWLDSKTINPIAVVSFVTQKNDVFEISLGEIEA